MEQREGFKNTDKTIDIRTTFSNLVKEEVPEMSQEEAIQRYRENDTIEPVKKSKKDSDSDDNIEESEHLKRIKQELLASLERVKQLAKKLYNEDRNKAKLNVKEKAGKQQSKKIEEKQNQT